MTEKELEGKAIKHVCSNCGHFERTGKITCDSKCECFHFYIGGVKEMQKEKEQLKKQASYLKDNLRFARKKLFDILTDYEIGNYDNNIHQFYEDVYDVHNELMKVEE